MWTSFVLAGQLLPSFTFVRKTGETDASGRQACDRLSRRMTELPNTCVAIFPNTVEKFLGRGWKRAAICYSSEESFSQQYGSFGVVYLLIVCEIILSCSRELFGKGGVGWGWRINSWCQGNTWQLATLFNVLFPSWPTVVCLGPQF